jgi:long-chain acyl-CoA synthetase
LGAAGQSGGGRVIDILKRAARDPDALAVDDLTRTRSCGELVDRAWRVASLLRDEWHLEPGDHAAMLMGNRVEFVELMFGALFAGVHLAPINWHLTAEEMRYILDDSQARAFFLDPELAGAATTLTATCPTLRAGAELDEALSKADNTAQSLDTPAGGPLLYTSGTTGHPKGVVRPSAPTIAESLAAAADGARMFHMMGTGPHLVSGPLYHGSPYGFASMELNIGASLLIMPRFDAKQMLELIVARKVHTTHLVPVMMTRMLALPEADRAAFDPSSLTCALHGAAPVSIAVKQRMIDWWGPRLVEYWGSSEGGAYCIATSEEWIAHPGTVGRAIERYEVFAVDDEGQRLGAGEVGLLYCRNKLDKEPFRYWNAPEKTRDVYLEPGTFTNYDMGSIDAEGYVYLSDRASDMIISGGVNIYPAEVEAALIEHAAVADVAVFGIPDPEWGEAVKAAVQLAPGIAAGAELEREILDWAREHIAAFKLPRSIDFEPELPRLPTGKLYKRKLREPYWVGHERKI